MASTEKEIQSLINTLGFLENGTYFPEPDCFQNVRDLIRYLHRDDRLHNVRRLCNEHNIVKNDLVPLMMAENVDEELFDVSLRTTVILCTPTLSVFDNKRPDDAAQWQLFYELETSLVRTIVAFTDVKIFKVFARKIREYFDLEWEDRTEKQRILVERIFVLIRYIFAIGIESIKHISVPEVDHCTREKVIASFFSSGIDEILLKLCGNSMEKEFCGYILAILALAFRTLDPRAISHAGEEDAQRRDHEKYEQEQAQVVEAIKTEEENIRKSSRRSFLAGTFVMKGMKALNPDRDFVMKGAPVNQENITPIEQLAKRKRARLPPRNRRVDNLEVTTTAEEHTTQTLQELNPDAMLAIKQFCTRLILEGKYNKLMRITKDMAFGRRQSSKITEQHFLSLAAFAIAFARHSRFSYQHIITTFSFEYFHQITAFLTECFDNMKTDKGNMKKYALSAQYAITVFKEITIMLNSISGSIFPEEKDFFRQFCYPIFQVEEYRELAAGILLHMTPGGTSPKMLQDLIIANHYFLHLMEKSVREGELVKIEKKKRQRKRKMAQKKAHKKQAKAIEEAVKIKELDTIWQEISEELTKTLSGENAPNEDASPINMLIKEEDEQLQQFALLQTQIALRTRKIADAVGIYRNARILWPETGTFGNDQATVEDEMLALAELFHSDMAVVSKQYTQALEAAYGRSGADFGEEKQQEEEEEEANNEEEEEEDENEAIDDQAAGYERVESEFDLNGFISSMAKPPLINWYIFALKRFRTNPKEVSHAIVKFFHRIAFDVKSPARLYLASLFTIFREINTEIGRATNSDNRSKHPHFELYQFGYHLLRKFFKHFEERGGGILACELLFHKTAKECYEIEQGYGTMD